MHHIYCFIIKRHIKKHYVFIARNASCPPLFANQVSRSLFFALFKNRLVLLFTLFPTLSSQALMIDYIEQGFRGALPALLPPLIRHLPFLITLEQAFARKSLVFLLQFIIVLTLSSNIIDKYSCAPYYGSLYYWISRPFLHLCAPGCSIFGAILNR